MASADEWYAMWSWQCQHGEDTLHIPAHDLGTRAEGTAVTGAQYCPCPRLGATEVKTRRESRVEVYHDEEAEPRAARTLQFSSAAQSCPTPCDPMDCSTLDLPVHHQLPEFTQTHVH